MEGSTGLPVCIQVVAHSWEDEKALGIMRAIEKKVNYRKKEMENL